MKKFEIGRLVASRGIMEQIESEALSDNDFRTFINKSFERYIKCDWGDLDEEDKALNDNAVERGDLRILAAYIRPETKEKIWIITEADRSYTTILFPNEY